MGATVAAAMNDSDSVVTMSFVNLQTIIHYVLEVWSSLESLCSFPSFCWQVTQQLHCVCVCLCVFRCVYRLSCVIQLTRKIKRSEKGVKIEKKTPRSKAAKVWWLSDVCECGWTSAKVPLNIESNDKSICKDKNIKRAEMYLWLQACSSTSITVVIYVTSFIEIKHFCILRGTNDSISFFS